MKFSPEELFLIIISILFLIFPQIGKIYIDNLSFGLSYGKVYMFSLMFLTMVAFRKTKIKIKSKKMILILLLILGYLYGLLGYLYISKDIGGYNKRYFFFDDKGYTSSGIYHYHTMKTPFCLISPIYSSEYYDCARPMLYYLPKFYPFLGMFLIIITSIVVIMESKNYEGWRFIAYVLLSLASLKTMIDGGLFNPETFYFIMLIVFFIKEDISFIIFGVLLSLCFHMATGHSIDIINNKYGQYILFFLPLTLAFYSLRINKYGKVLFILFLLLAAILSPYIYPHKKAIIERWPKNMESVCKYAKESKYLQTKICLKVNKKCNFEENLECGKITCKKNQICYRGNDVEKPELIFSYILGKRGFKGIINIEDSQIIIEKT